MLHLSRQIWIRTGAFAVIALIAMLVMAFGFMRLPSLLFGVGQYTVTVELPEAGGLYERGNVTYRGTEVGTVKQVHLTDTGVEAVLSLKSDIAIPSDLEAEVHSQSAVGEQYVALLPRNASSPPLKNGDVITRANTSVPPDINALLDATNRGLQAIPQDNLQTVIDESYDAFGGLGPEIGRFLKGGSALARDSRKNLDELINLVDNSQPLLQTQIDTSDSIQAWAAHLADATQSLKDNDTALRGVLEGAPGASDQVRQLFDRLQPTLPILLANLVSVGPVAVDYRDNLEQLLVLLPQGTAAAQGITLPNRATKQDYSGGFLSFNLNVNLPPACTTGFLPAQQQRPAALEDYPDRPAGMVYCRTPQDSPFNGRGAKNYPCATKPGKRAPTAAMCESDEEYVPLNDGFNWKGDPNATSSGQAIPQFPPGQEPPPGYPRDQLPVGAPPPAGPPAPAVPAGAVAPAAVPPVAVARYDPATGTYVGPDGKVYTQANLAQGHTQSWQSMLVPPGM